MPGRGRWAPSLDSLFVAAFALLGVRLGSVPIGDNSAFWHIRTGIDALAGRGIPASDPYSWTAAGHPWVVQSWLAELAYGAAHRLGGLGAVVVVNGVLLGAVAGVMALLAMTGRPRRTLLAAGVAVAVSAGWWSPRPLLFGLLLLAVTIWLVERQSRLVWFALIGAAWVSVHGSFVLGPAWIVLTVVGALVDRRVGIRRTIRADLGRAAALAGGAVVGAIVSPPGWRLLTFPATAVVRREAFASVIEWQRPDLFAGPVEVLAAVGLAVGGVVLIATRPPLRLALPAVVFAGAGLVSQRNMAVAGLVFAPALAAGLRGWRPQPAGADVAGSPPINRALAAVMAAVTVLFLTGGGLGRGLELDDYPVAAVRWMEDRGLRDAGTRLAHTDVAGGWLILRDGREARVFVDDRVDMYPDEVLADYRTLLDGGGAAVSVLDDRGVDAVLWPSDEALVAVLADEPGWSRAYAADGWEVWLRG